MDATDASMRSILDDYLAYLADQERAASTCAQYRREVERFITWAEAELRSGSGKGASPARAIKPASLRLAKLTKDMVIAYKRELQRSFKPSSVNTKLAAVNGFLSHAGRADLRVKPLKIQRAAFQPQARGLSRAEYLRLVDTAIERGDERLALIMQTICATGIRVSELRFITMEAVERGQARVHLKGKDRAVLLPGDLQHRLKEYAEASGCASGPIFVTRSGRPLDRTNIWKMMRRLCPSAGVNPHKVFPHNLRHLFARCYYQASRDLAKLADVLGHSSVNTTRAYLVTTAAEHGRCLDGLGLVVTSCGEAHSHGRVRQRGLHRQNASQRLARQGKQQLDAIKMEITASCIT